MSAFRRLIGVSPVEIRDNLDAFIEYYKEHNIPYKQDLKRLREGLMPGINNTNDLKEAHSLRKTYAITALNT